MEEFTKSVCDYVIECTKEYIDEPESQKNLREIVSRGIMRNVKKLPSSEEGPDVLKFRTKIETGRTTTVSAYNLHWNDWKENNIQKEYPDPDDPTKKLTAHKYWKKHIWDPMGKEERKPWDDKAKKAREELHKSGGAKAKRKVSKSGFQLFLAKMKSKMDPEEEFTHPDNGQTVKLHHYLLYIWSNHVKTNDSLKQEFDEMAAKLKSGELADFDLNDLPYLDPEKLRNHDFDDLEMVSEE